MTGFAKFTHELALVDVDNRKLAMALIPLAARYSNARQTLWSRKRAAAALLDVTLRKYHGYRDGACYRYGKSWTERNAAAPREREGTTVRARVMQRLVSIHRTL